jgi:hypothetical protein
VQGRLSALYAHYFQLNFKLQKGFLSAPEGSPTSFPHPQEKALLAFF